MLQKELALLLGVLGLTVTTGQSSNVIPSSSSSAVSYVNIGNVSSSSQFRSIGTTGGGERRNNGIQLVRFDGRDSTLIVFPQSKSQHKSNARKVPLHVLKVLSSETDFVQVVGKYVQNADILKIEDTGEQVLVRRKNGEEIKDSTGNRIVVASVPQISTPLVTRYPGTGNIVERVGPISRLGPLAAGSPAKNIPDKSPPVAVCRPEQQTVEVPVTFDPNIIYYPRCVRVERCGGCCGSHILACEPKLPIIQVNVTVRKLEYIGDGNNTKLDFVAQENVLVDKHTSCECQCRIKPGDCSSRQVYKDCLCTCQNEEEKGACVEDPQKTWDPVTCDCACREIKDCNSGFLFDLRTCQCVPIPSSPRKRKRTLPPPRRYN